MNLNTILSSNSRKRWTQNDIKQLKELVEEKTSIGLIASHLQRTVAAVQSKASMEGISLKSTYEYQSNNSLK